MRTPLLITRNNARYACLNRELRIWRPVTFELNNNGRFSVTIRAYSIGTRRRLRRDGRGRYLFRTYLVSTILRIQCDLSHRCSFADLTAGRTFDDKHPADFRPRNVTCRAYWPMDVQRSKRLPPDVINIERVRTDAEVNNTRPPPFRTGGATRRLRAICVSPFALVVNNGRRITTRVTREYAYEIRKAKQRSYANYDRKTLLLRSRFTVAVSVNVSLPSLKTTLRNTKRVARAESFTDRRKYSVAYSIDLRARVFIHSTTTGDIGYGEFASGG